MIETEEQQRWWFATHPEYSWSRKGIRARGRSAGQSSNSSSAKYEDQIKSAAHELELWRQAIERDRRGLERDPHTALDLAPYQRFITSPVQALKDLFRNAARDAILSAVKRAETQGPGKWVEVSRSSLGLEHQSKMSGQAIINRDGKYYIREYELNGVKFDDFKDGKLYDYKGSQGNLLKNREGEFKDWARAKREAYEEAQRQVTAAQGIPVVWKVGADQVKAFEKAVGYIEGLIIIP
jgi:hypothetical protein